MEIDVTPDQQALIRHAIETGRLQTAEEAVKEALSLWEARERGREGFLARLDMARASIGRGEGIAITQDSLRELAEDVKQRGRARLAADRPAPI